MINVGAVFRKRGGGGWSGLVSHACPKQGHATVMLFKRFLLHLLSSTFPQRKLLSDPLIRIKDSTATANLFGGFMYVYIYIGFIQFPTEMACRYIFFILFFLKKFTDFAVFYTHVAHARLKGGVRGRQGGGGVFQKMREVQSGRWWSEDTWVFCGHSIGQNILKSTTAVESVYLGNTSFKNTDKVIMIC